MKKTCFAILLLALAALLPAQYLPLNLTAPNGGENWSTGSTYAITWTQINLTGYANLLLVGGNDPNSANFPIAQSVPVQSCSFNWTIPAAIPAGSNYRVRIALPNATGALIYDLSDGPFTISGGTNPPPPPYSITVTAPNGGETWPAGSTQMISWNYTGITGEVSIGLIGTASNTQLILAPAVPVADQNFAWSIPSTIVPGSYRVHIVWLTPLAIYIGDLSDAPFFITNGTPPPPPSLTVLAPNGGEIWQAGTMHPITWDYSGPEATLLIQLLGGPQMTPINIIANNVPATAGVFEWNIPPYQLPGDFYQVQINLVDPAGVFIGDASDAPFTITAGTGGPGSITVLTPNGGEVWETGTSQNISWNYYDLTGEVYIALIGANTNAQTIIAQAVPIADQSFSWTIPPNLPTGPYKVHIVWLSMLDIYIGDMSDNFFQIVNVTPPPIVLTSPNGGEIWTAGTSYPITWTSTGLNGMVNLHLIGTNDPNGALIPIAMGIPLSDLQFDWAIPWTIPPGTNYRVRISLVASNGMFISDLSDGTFTIEAGDDPPPQTLVVTSPNGGEQWTKGTQHEITWTAAAYTGFVRIVLIWEGPNNLRRFPIARNAPNTGSFSWLIPLRVPVGTHYKIAVQDQAGALDLSDGQFSIISPFVDLSTAPNPTREGTTLSFSVPAPVSASVRVYNLKGQCVRILVEGEVLSGQQTIVWDGKDSQGNKVAAGIYLARISSPQFTVAKRIVVR